jgi:hypothetical protein
MGSVASIFKGQAGLNDATIGTIEQRVQSALETILTQVTREELRPMRETLTALLARMIQTEERLERIYERIEIANEAVSEVKSTDFYGKTRSILPDALKQVEGMSGSEVRRLLHRAASAHPKGRKAGFNDLFQRVVELSGVDIFELGKERLGKKDGIDGWKKDPSYINTILKHGLKDVAAVVAKEMQLKK